MTNCEMEKVYEKALRQEAYDIAEYGSAEFHQQWNAFRVKKEQAEIGKIILAESKEDDTTRLFVKRLSTLCDVTTKNGWWDMFTVTNTPCKKGIWACRIDVIRLDRNGYPMMEVTPLSYLGEDIDDESIAWDYFGRTGLFSKYYIMDHLKVRFNVEEVENRFQDAWKSYDTEEYRKQLESEYIPSYSWTPIFLWQAFCEGKVTLKEIEETLNVPEGFEAMAIFIAKNYKELEETYPLMIAKIKSLNDGFISARKIEDYLFSRYYSACDIQREGKISKDIKDTYELIEASLRYYKEKKEAEKAAKKAAKKAKKANP